MVLGVSMPLVSGAPPNSGAGARGLPFPPSPWHGEHFSAKTRAPWTAVPLPGGKPVPSGITAMSQALMSASERSKEHTSELQSQSNLVCRLLLEKKKKKTQYNHTE